jgi:hypothetical protein
MRTVLLPVHGFYEKYSAYTEKVKIYKNCVNLIFLGGRDYFTVHPDV